jgi:hypothetical protein
MQITIRTIPTHSISSWALLPLGLYEFVTAKNRRPTTRPRGRPSGQFERHRYSMEIPAALAGLDHSQAGLICG